MKRFSVSYAIVTPESAEDNETADQDFILQDAPLRDALAALHETRTCKVDGVNCIEADCSPCIQPRAITVVNGQEFETGAYESRTLHFPRGITAASARRLARLAGVRV